MDPVHEDLSVIRTLESPLASATAPSEVKVIKGCYHLLLEPVT